MRVLEKSTEGEGRRWTKGTQTSFPKYQPQDPALLGPQEEHPDQGLPAASHKLQGSPAMGSRSGSPIFTWARVLARVSLGS